MIAVIFASVTNFDEFYSENYKGGRECLRVLNELISDFDDLLALPQYSSVEKIKTIGSTYMAASGLSMTQRNNQSEPNEHLHALISFALDMQRTIDDFNSNMLGFEFRLRIGFNFGPVTSGVVGSTKLLYDIWGNTVNVASRMDSTGVQGRIQVSACVFVYTHIKDQLFPCYSKFHVKMLFRQDNKRENRLGLLLNACQLLT